MLRERDNILKERLIILREQDTIFWKQYNILKEQDNIFGNDIIMLSERHIYVDQVLSRADDLSSTWLDNKCRKKHRLKDRYMDARTV